MGKKGFFCLFGEFVLRGVNSISLDAKGRLAIPTRYRQELQEGCDQQLVVTVAINEHCVGEKGCLWLYPIPEWEKLELTISKLSSLNKMAGDLRRFLIGHATDCEMDTQGRLLLPENLRAYAGMKKYIMLVGQLNKFEIWNKDSWVDKENEWLSGDNREGREEIGQITF